jgi:hypothetical protein
VCSRPHAADSIQYSVSHTVPQKLSTFTSEALYVHVEGRVYQAPADSIQYIVSHTVAKKSAFTSEALYVHVEGSELQAPAIYVRHTVPK